MTHSPANHGPLLNRQVLIGAAMMVIGLGFLSDLSDRAEINLWSSSWTLLLFGVGLLRVIDPGDGEGYRASRRTGAWLMSVGAWGWVSHNELFGFGFETSWPLLIVAAGVITVWWALDESRRPSSSRRVN